MNKNPVLYILVILLLLSAAACGPETAPDEKTAETAAGPAALPAVTETVPVREPASLPAETEQAPTGMLEVRSSEGVIDLPDLGMKITLPEPVRDIPVTVKSTVQDGHTVVNLCLADDSDPDNQGCVFGEIVAYPEAQDHDSMVGDRAGMTGEMVMDLGATDSLNYYALRLDELRNISPEEFEKLSEGLSEEQKQQYNALIDALPDVIGGVELTGTGQDSALEADEAAEEAFMDLVLPDPEGNDVRLGGLIAENRVTMLNAWGISCGPCMTEMPCLVSLRDRFKDQGFEIIGLTSDLTGPDGGIDPELAEEAKAVIADLGVDYPVLNLPQTVRDQLGVMFIPTTWFVTGSGRVIGEPVLGSRSEGEWEKMITDALAAAQ